MPNKRNHWVAVNIQCLDPQSAAEASNRLKHWLEAFGHTSLSHGFEIWDVSVSPIPKEGGK